MNSSLLIFYSVGDTRRRLGLGMRLSIRWLIGRRSAPGLRFRLIDYPPITRGATQTETPPSINATPIGFVTRCPIWGNFSKTMNKVARPIYKRL